MSVLKQHLLSRHVDLNLHKVWIDEENNIATFPLYNLSSQLIGFHQYRPDKNKLRKNNPREGRYFTHVSKEKKGVWGLESFKLSNALFITEGVFDAARLTSNGCSAIAVISNNPKHISSLLMLMRKMRPVIAICDYGKAGLKLSRFGSKFHVMPEEFDLGDAPEDYVKSVIKEYST